MNNLKADAMSEVYIYTHIKRKYSAWLLSIYFPKYRLVKSKKATIIRVKRKLDGSSGQESDSKFDYTYSPYL